jgi:hypothetical protein
VTGLRIEQVGRLLALSQVVALVVTVVNCGVTGAAEFADVRQGRIVALQTAVDTVEGRVHVRYYSFIVYIASRQRRARPNLAELSELPLVAHVGTLNELVKEIGLEARVHLIGATVCPITSLGYISLVAVN